MLGNSSYKLRTYAGLNIWTAISYSFYVVLMFGYSEIQLSQSIRRTNNITTIHGQR